MHTGDNYPRVFFPYELDERGELEMNLKGFTQAYVETEGGSRYSLYFSDPVRLQQDLEELVEHGYPCFAEPGLVVLPEVTVAGIKTAIIFLYEQGFFASLVPSKTD